MTHSQIFSAIAALRPGANFSMCGDEIHWSDQVQTQPDEQEIITEVQRQDSLDVQRIIVTEAQRRLDAFARERGYDDMRSLVSYAGDTDPQFVAEASIGMALRSATWSALRRIEEAVRDGHRHAPREFADVAPDLPLLSWMEPIK